MQSNQRRMIVIIQSLLTIILCVSTQYNFEEQISRSTTLPIQLINGVPYLQLNQLCEAQIKQQIKGSKHILDTRKWDDEQSSQFQQISNFYQQSDVTVLLDTGSTQLWLADSSCSNCQLKKSLCPHLLTSEKKIIYVKGYIQGIDSYINLCGNRMKFLCVKTVQGIGQLNSEGIMGLKKGSNGFNMLFKLLKKGNQKINLISQNKQTLNNKYTILYKQQISFIYNSYINQLILKISKQAYDNNNKYNRLNIIKNNNNNIKYVKSNSNWSFIVKQISLFDNQIIIDQKQLNNNNNRQIIQNNNIQMNKQMKAYIDTGSTKIVVSNLICSSIMKKMLQMNIKCQQQPRYGIHCSKIIDNFKMRLKLEQIQQQQDRNDNIILQIQDRYLIDPLSNRINIICQGPSTIEQQQQKIILGYPFFKSYQTTFIVQQQHSYQNTRKQNKQQIGYKIRMQPYDPQQINNQQWMINIIVILYLCGIAVLSYVAVITIDFVRNKRSRKIII